MNTSRSIARVLMTILGLAVYAMLALGSIDDKHDKHTDDHPPPKAEDVGKENALAWAKSNFADLATEMQALESEKNHAQQQIHHLETLKEQFPIQASEIIETIGEWKKVEIELTSALTSVEKYISEAYVVRQMKGKDQDAILRQVYERWRPEAERAAAFAKRQEAKSNSESSESGAR